MSDHFKEMPMEIREQLDRDVSIYGNGFAEWMDDGTWRRIDPTRIAVKTVHSSSPKYGEPAILPLSRQRLDKDR